MGLFLYSLEIFQQALKANEPACIASEFVIFPANRKRGYLFFTCYPPVIE